MRSRVTMLVVVVSLCLTGCAPVVSGTGRRHLATSSPGAPSSPGATSTTPPSTSADVLRVPQTGPVGDPVTAELCGGISMAAFAPFGVARRHGWQTATTCYIDVYRPDSTYFQLNAWVEQSSVFGPGARPPKQLASGNSLFTFRMHHQDCERALEIDSVVLETHTYNVSGSVPAGVLCGAASTLAHQQIIAFAEHHTQRRSLASHSLTRFDLCALMSYGHYDRVNGLENATTQPFLEEAGCDAYSPQIDVSARVAFVDLGFPLRGRHVTFRGHRLIVWSGPKLCEIVSVQHATGNGRAHEILDVAAHRRAAFTGRLCRSAELVTAGMLHAGQLD